MKNWIVLLAAILTPPAANAQSITTDFTERFIRQRSIIEALGTNPFGEKIGLYVGNIEFVQTDIDLPGNNSLSVSLGRRFVPYTGYGSDDSFRDWALDIPHIHGIFSTKYGWTVSYGGPSTERCSKYFTPMDGDVSDGSLSKSETFWNGTHVYLPGSGDQEILRRGLSTPYPSGGGNYPLTTADGSVFRCTSSLANGSEGSGEGFVMARPDGTTIQFDHMVSRYALAQENSNGGVLSLKEYRMLPTIVSDRFGNTVTYTWSGPRLVSIVASDGRRIDTIGHPITSATDGMRTWTYEYANDSSHGGRTILNRVILPDASAWKFSLGSFYFANPPVYTGINCDEDGPGLGLSGASVGTIVHPSGLAGEFTIAATAHGRSWVPMNCRDTYPGPSHPLGGYAYQPRIFGNWSITKRKLTGPGLPTQGQVWTYAYGPTNHCWSWAEPWGTRVCNSNSPSTKTVDVTAPDGAVTRYTFGNRFEENEGKLLRTDEGWNGSGALRTVVNTYAMPDAGPYPDYIGYSVQPRGDGSMSTRHTPLRATTITQQQRVFTWQVANDCTGIPFCFDTYARPTKVLKVSAPAP